MAVQLPVAQVPVAVEKSRLFSATRVLPQTARNSSKASFAFSSQPAKRSLQSSSPLSVSVKSSSVDNRAIGSSEGIASSLEGVKILDLSGKSIPIVDLWRDRKAVIAFARHFGCVLCRKRADLLASKQDVLNSAGVALALIGPGSVEQARAFAEQTKFKGEIYADPNHSSYEALQFAYGVTKTFTPLAGLKIIQSYMEGYRQDWGLSFQKDTVERGGWQQGGIMVAGPGVANILYIHKDKEAGDDPDMEDVLKACLS